MSIQTKPRVAIETGLLTRDEAAEYLGMSEQGFSRIARHLTSVRLGQHKFYSKNQLHGYLAQKLNDPTIANIQQTTT